ncbi:hypothetical protein [Defluviimonas salinarum]|uniref:N-acetyltransferase domain-containing protein n=1 Tax=Defluviimonas salinarum TaxID=2992147 RepID=A0ABT3J4E1_9RHOB|nr:hypothetical protein [Defluviimonas salinarum]MCW3782552.1 hypothetical protein [Defluviimonas salinarum]
MARAGDKQRLETLEAEFSGLEEDAFLAGPDRDAGDLDIDAIFATPWRDVFQDLAWDVGLAAAPDKVVQAWLQGLLAGDGRLPDRPGIAGIAFCEAREAGTGDPLGIVAVDITGPEPVLAGSYTGAQLGVSDAHRGRGIAARLVMERFLLFGTLPTWDLDTPAYSPGGEAAHLAGFRLLEEELALLRTIRLPVMEL